MPQSPTGASANGSETGSPRILERVLRLPYMRGQAYCELIPGLWIGRRLGCAEATRFLSESNATAVLDLAPEATETAPLRKQAYCNIPILDFTTPTLDQLRDAVAWIDQHIGEGVYIHCALGYTRTATIAAAYLLHKGIASTPENAIETIRDRKPLTAVIGFAELLVDGKVGTLTPEQQDFTQDILANGKHLLSLINDVLDLARVESGTMPFHPERICLPDVIRETSSRSSTRC
jgi:hypothetical protein